MKSKYSDLTKGYRIPELTLKPISKNTLALYADASGDQNPIHIDLDFAKKVGLPNVIAHGMLIMSYLAQSLTNIFPQSCIKFFDVKFISITHLNEIMNCSGKLVKIKSRDSQDELSFELKVKNKIGEKKLLGFALIKIE